MNTAKFLKAICLALLVLGALRGGAAGQSTAATNEPSRQPILRIETGMHTAGIKRIKIDLAGFIKELTSAENGAVVFAASTGGQVSLENKEWNNGAFTKAIVEGIGDRADYTGKGKITINSLDLYLSERVKELTRGRQTPTTTKPKTVPDFPIAVKQ